VPKLFATSIERYTGGARERRKYGGQGTITVFLVGEEGSDAGTWIKLTGHGRTPGERKTDALRQYHARTAAPLAGGRWSMRGLGFAPLEHVALGLKQTSEASVAFTAARAEALQGRCSSALQSFRAGAESYGSAQAHAIAAEEDNDRLEIVDRQRAQAQQTIQGRCLRPIKKKG